MQVLLNLVANAVQYNRPGGRVWMQVEREQDGIVLSVHDDGPGIDAQDLPRLFEPFYRAPSAAGTAARPGSGLDVMRAVQDDVTLVRTTCVAFSAAGDPAAADEAIRAGFRDFLSKPIDAETFLRALDRLLEAASARMW